MQESKVTSELLIAISNGRTFVGAPSVDATGRIYLSPVCELSIQLAMDPAGQMRVTYMGTPIMMLPSVDGVSVPSGAVIIPTGDLTSHERAQLDGAMRQAEALGQQMRAATAGLTLATSMPSARNGRFGAT